MKKDSEKLVVIFLNSLNFCEDEKLFAVVLKFFGLHGAHVEPFIVLLPVSDAASSIRIQTTKKKILQA